MAGLSVDLPDGRRIEPDQVLGEPRKGTSLVVIGDTGRIDNLLPHVENADALVIESTYIKAEEDLADRFDHLTAERAATLAKEAGVSQLFLTHLSRRYRERDVLEEAQAIFPDVHVARDFDRFLIAKGRLAQKIDSSAHPVEDDDSAHLDDLELTPLEGQ